MNQPTFDFKETQAKPIFDYATRRGYQLDRFKERIQEDLKAIGRNQGRADTIDVSIMWNTLPRLLKNGSEGYLEILARLGVYEKEDGVKPLPAVKTMIQNIMRDQGLTPTKDSMADLFTALRCRSKMQQSYVSVGNGAYELVDPSALFIKAGSNLLGFNFVRHNTEFLSQLEYREDIRELALLNQTNESLNVSPALHMLFTGSILYRAAFDKGLPDNCEVNSHDRINGILLLMAALRRLGGSDLTLYRFALNMRMPEEQIERGCISRTVVETISSFFVDSVDGRAEKRIHPVLSTFIYSRSFMGELIGSNDMYKEFAGNAAYKTAQVELFESFSVALEQFLILGLSKAQIYFHSSVIIPKEVWDKQNELQRSVGLVIIEKLLRLYKELDGVPLSPELQEAYKEAKTERVGLEDSYSQLSDSTCSEYVELLMQLEYDPVAYVREMYKLATEAGKLMMEGKFTQVQENTAKLAEKNYELTTKYTLLTKSMRGIKETAKQVSVVERAPVQHDQPVEALKEVLGTAEMERLYIEEIDTLTHQLKDAQAQLLECNTKLASAGQMIAQKTESVQKTEVIPNYVLRCMREDLSLTDVYDVIQEMFPHVVFAKGVRESLDKNLFNKPRRLLSNLVQLCGPYLEAILSGTPDAEAMDVLGNTYKANESDAVLNNDKMRRQRMIEVNGQKELFIQHLTIGSRNGEAYTIQVHFKIIDGVLYIGRIGEHLTTKSF